MIGLSDSAIGVRYGTVGCSRIRTNFDYEASVGHTRVLCNQKIIENIYIIRLCTIYNNEQV